MAMDDARFDFPDPVLQPINRPATTRSPRPDEWIAMDDARVDFPDLATQHVDTIKALASTTATACWRLADESAHVVCWSALSNRPPSTAATGGRRIARLGRYHHDAHDSSIDNDSSKCCVSGPCEATASH